MWLPDIPDGPAPLYLRLLDAMRRDIADGGLTAGERLPPQRELALAAGLGLGTVTRAYAEAERLGLMTATVGRGSFVADHRHASEPAIIDLSRNLPPTGPAERRLAEALATLQRSPGLVSAAGYAPNGGGERHRRAMAGWLGFACGLEVTAECVVLCAGAQQGLTLAFAASLRPGDTILCEDATYYGVKSLAEAAGYTLCGMAMDEDGLIPEALEEAALKMGARTVFLQPTLQNPTTRTMSLKRRQAIADLARRLKLWLIEDDVYGLYAGTSRLPPLAALAPERTFFVTSLSKSVAPGLRAGAVVAPWPAQHERLLRVADGLLGAGDAFGWRIAALWIEDGTAAAIADETRREAEARLSLALAIFGDAAVRPLSSASLHLWLPMTALQAEQVAGRAQRAGVQVTPPGAPQLDGSTAHGLRLCLCAPRQRDMLDKGLRIVADAMAGHDQHLSGLV